MAPTRSHRRRFAILVAVLAVFAAACATTRKQTAREAAASAYDAPFAAVYREAIAAVASHYPEYVEDSRSGVIETAWHPIRVQPGELALQGGSYGHESSPVGTAPADRASYFVRMKVRVVPAEGGGGPWRILVHGEASKWQAGGVPARLRGGDEPPWLSGRIDGLRAAIHERLADRAVAIEGPPREKEEAAPTRRFGAMPDAAARIVAAVYDAASGRDLDALEALMSDPFASRATGESPRQVVVAIWRAEPGRLDALAAALESGCRRRGSADRIECGAAAFERREGAWRLVRFSP